MDDNQNTPEQIGFYTIRGIVGRGGMATVYRAFDTRVNQEVALKVLPPHQATDPAYLRRFLDEGQKPAALDHPNIVTIYEAGEADGYYYIAMEFIAGGTLIAYLQERQTLLSYEQTIGVIKQLASGLDYAHTQGFLHRDIKPSNILITGDLLDPGNRVLIADFGVARHTMDVQQTMLTQAGHTVGTPAFMSPEQAKGSREIDQRSDIYSLGVIAYALFTEKLPYSGDTSLVVMHKIVYEDPIPPENHKPDLPPGIVYALKRVLLKDPPARYRTAGDFAAALEEGMTWVPGSSTIATLAQPATPLQQAKVTTQKSGFSWMWLITIVAALLLFFIGLLFLDTPLSRWVGLGNEPESIPGGQTLLLRTYQDPQNRFVIDAPDEWIENNSEDGIILESPDISARIFVRQLGAENDAAVDTESNNLRSSNPEQVIERYLQQTNLPLRDLQPLGKIETEPAQLEIYRYSGRWQGTDVSIQLSTMLGAPDQVPYIVGTVVDDAYTAAYSPIFLRIFESVRLVESSATPVSIALATPTTLTPTIPTQTVGIQISPTVAVGLPETVVITDIGTVAPATSTMLASVSTVTPRPTNTSAATQTETSAPTNTAADTPTKAPSHTSTNTRVPPSPTATPSDTPTIDPAVVAATLKMAADETATALASSRPSTTIPSTTPLPARTAATTPTASETENLTSTLTDLPTATPTETETATPKPTSTSTDLPTATPTDTATDTHTPTSTSTDLPTATPTKTETATPKPTSTSTDLPTATPTDTATATPKPTSTSTDLPTATSTETETATPKPTSTSTDLPTATSTEIETATPKPTSTPTELPTAILTETATVELTGIPSITTTEPQRSTPTQRLAPTQSPTQSSGDSRESTMDPDESLLPISGDPASTENASLRGAISRAGARVRENPVPTLEPTRIARNASSEAGPSEPPNVPPAVDSTAMPEATPKPTATAAPTQSRGATPTSRATAIIATTSTRTARPTNSATNTPRATETFTLSPTKRPTASSTSTATDTVTSTATSAATSTATDTATSTATSTATNTVTNTSTWEPTSTSTRTGTATSTATTTPNRTQTVEAAMATAVAETVEAYTLVKTAVAATLTAIAQQTPPTATPTNTSIATNTSTPTSTFTRFPTRIPTSTHTRTATPVPTATQTPTVPTATSTATSTATATQTTTATIPPTAVPTVPLETVTPLPPTVPPNASVTLLGPFDPILRERVVFSWQSNITLQGNQYYELVFWEPGQDVMAHSFGPVGAKTETTVSVNLDAASDAIPQFASGRDYQWGVLLVELNPYRRISHLGGSQLFRYERSGGNGGGGPRPTNTPRG
ncbi:MAG: protein kinase [Chloroflexota bacterium]